MDPEAIIAHLNEAKGLPKEALRAAAAHRTLLVPRFIQIIEDHLALPPSERPQKAPLFFIFHLLGDWREATAYRPLLRLPEPEIGKILGDAITPRRQTVLSPRCSTATRNRYSMPFSMPTLTSSCARACARRCPAWA